MPKVTMKARYAIDAGKHGQIAPGGLVILETGNPHHQKLIDKQLVVDENHRDIYTTDDDPVDLTIKAGKQPKSAGDDA
jgi:hypothetical protein